MQLSRIIPLVSGFVALLAGLMVGCGPGDVPVYDRQDSTPVEGNPQDMDSDGRTTTVDCDDHDAATYLGAPEVCEDGVDQDCNGSDLACDHSTPTATPPVDQDSDNDGYSDAEDCDDGNASIHPNATETCNNTDDDCDGSLDDGLTFYTLYKDLDDDGYGSSSSGTSSTCYTEVPDDDPAYSWSFISGDCDDTKSSVYPGAVEQCDSIDNDCDGSVDENGTAVTTWYRDVDGDGYGTTASSASSCSQPSGYVSNSTDCNDNSASIHPNATETCNSVDDDCDGTVDDGATTVTWYYDADGDTYGSSTLINVSCSKPSGSYVSRAGDCNDSSASVYPGATEICNGVDDDCDGVIDESGSATTWYKDADGDTYGTTNTTLTACAQPTGYVSRSGDCDDSKVSVYTGATELCDSIDNDCDGSIDEGASSTNYYVDGDGDGYGKSGSTATVTCTKPTGYVSNNTDCVDTNAAIHPGAVETTNGVDDDCDGTIDEGTEALVQVNYSAKGYYTLNAQVFTAASQLGSEWDETASVTSANAVQVEFTTAEYGSLNGFCGVRLNVTVGNPGYDWLCEGGAIDKSVQVDI